MGCENLRRQVIGLCAPLFILAGCAGYVPPSLPESEVATITNHDPYLQLDKIDGKAVGRGRFEGTTTLTPGPHEIMVRYYREVPDKFLSKKIWEARAQLRLEAISGAKYAPKCSVIGYKAVFWIEDAQSGQVVAGARPKQPGETNPAGPAAIR